MTQSSEHEENIRESVRNVVRDTISEVVYRIVKMSTKRAINELKNKLKEKSIQKMETKLRDISEQRFQKQLTKSTNRVVQEITKDVAERVDFISEIERGFEKGFTRYLSSLPKVLTPFKATVISIVFLSAIGVLIPPLLINEPPVINSFTANPSIVNPGVSSSITCVASDPDGDELSFSWSATDGTIIGSGNKVIWKAPLAPGDYTINVIVSDGDGGTTEGSRVVIVNQPPVVTRVTMPCNGVTNVSLTPTFVWNVAEGADSYQFVLADSAEFTGPLVNEKVPESAYNLDFELDYNTTYYWKVQAYKGNEAISPWSDVCVFTCMAEAPPAPP